MTKLEWDRVEIESRIRRFGTQPARAKPGQHPGSRRSKRKRTQDKRRKSTRLGNLSKVERQFLDQIISAKLMGQRLPKPPENLPSGVKQLIALSGGMVEWAKTHPYFETRLRLVTTRLRAASNPKPTR